MKTCLYAIPPADCQCIGCVPSTPPAENSNPSRGRDGADGQGVCTEFVVMFECDGVMQARIYKTFLPALLRVLTVINGGGSAMVHRQ